MQVMCVLHAADVYITVWECCFFIVHSVKAFGDALGRYLAFSYYITGNRGEAKKIVLDRRYVSWETEDE